MQGEKATPEEVKEEMERRTASKEVPTEKPDLEPGIFRGDGEAHRSFGTDEDFKFEELVLPPYVPDKFSKQ